MARMRGRNDGTIWLGMTMFQSVRADVRCRPHCRDTTALLRATVLQTSDRD